MNALDKFALEYTRSLKPKRCSDVFDSPHVSLNKYKNTSGEDKAVVVVSLMLTDVADFFNVSQNLSLQQIATTSEMILDSYGWLKIDDLKLCFDRGRRGMYGEVYRLDGQVILSWINKYINERMDEAEQASYAEHMSSKETRADNSDNLRDIIKQNIHK